MATSHGLKARDPPGFSPLPVHFTVRGGADLVDAEVGSVEFLFLAQELRLGE
jgi:hypothetical protein